MDVDAGGETIYGRGIYWGIRGRSKFGCVALFATARMHVLAQVVAQMLSYCPMRVKL